MEIKIISSSTEIIKPSSPTPQHLRTYKIFLSKQAMPDFYVPVTFFYSAPRENNNTIKHISTHLKTSLSKLLTYYYPFAGQNIDGVSIYCNDHGVPFIETQVANNMSDLLRKKYDDRLNLKPLIPFNNKLSDLPNSCHHPCLFVQVNYFACGGIAITIFVSHSIADGSTASYLVKNWGEVARGANDIKNVIVDYSSIYHPHDAVASVTRFYNQNYCFQGEMVTKMFAFDGKKIVALREKIRSGPYLGYHPTRFEAISALIFCSLINITITIEKDEPASTQVALTIPINVRNKTIPPLPSHSLGNMLTVTVVKLTLDKKIDFDYVASKIHETIKKAVDQYKRNVHEQEREHEGGLIVKTKIFSITDVSKFPYYEADFGWGKPLWVVASPLIDNVVVLMDSCNGEGIEACVGLPKEYMDKFEKDPEILAHAQFSTSKMARL